MKSTLGSDCQYRYPNLRGSSCCCASWYTHFLQLRASSSSVQSRSEKTSHSDSLEEDSAPARSAVDFSSLPLLISILLSGVKRVFVSWKGKMQRGDGRGVNTKTAGVHSVCGHPSGFLTPLFATVDTPARYQLHAVSLKSRKDDSTSSPWRHAHGTGRN